MEAASTIESLLVGGNDTTSRLISSFYFRINRNPEIKKKLMEEIESKL
jgi:cytochrome P450